MLLGVYFSGDGAHRYSNGYYRITGRVDDVINTSGHRLGTAEIEDVMVCSVVIIFLQLLYVCADDLIVFTFCHG